MENKYWDSLDKAGLAGSNLCRGKNDCKSRGIFRGLYLASKIIHSLTAYECGIIEEHKTFEGFTDSRRLLDRSQYFKKIEGKKYQLCCLKVGKNRLVVEFSCQQKKIM